MKVDTVQQQQFQQSQLHLQSQPSYNNNDNKIKTYPITTSTSKSQLQSMNELEKTVNTLSPSTSSKYERGNKDNAIGNEGKRELTNNDIALRYK